MSSYDLSLNNPENDARLARVHKAWLNALGVSDARAPLDAKPSFDRATQAALRRFQRSHGLAADGVCGIRTWQALCRQVSRQAHPNLVNIQGPRWLINLLNNRNRVAGGRLALNRALFKTMYKTDAHHLGAGNDDLTNLDALLDFLAGDPLITDVRWAAYMLATVRHDCGGWSPSEESGGVNKNYGQATRAECPEGSGRFVENSYRGRGYVHLRHVENYRRADNHFGLNCRLMQNPGLLITDRQLSYNVMSWGMREGIFRRVWSGDPHTLARYINDHVTDYFNARNIVNSDLDPSHGRDRQMNGRIIEGYALIFEPIIRACLLN